MCAFRDEDDVVGIIADCAVTNQQYQVKMLTPKLVEAGKLIYGYAGIIPPKLPQKKYPATITGVEQLAKALFKAQIAHGHGISEEGVLCVPTIAIIVGPGLGPFLVGSCGEVIESQDGYVAIGSGAGIAMGVLHCCKFLETDTSTALQAAITAAIELDPYSNGPASMHLFK